MIITMLYDITKPTAPAMPRLGKGLEAIRLLLSQTSKDMHAPLLPMLFPVLGAKISNVEFQYPSGQWLELCGQMAALVADSGNNKGQFGLLVEAMMRNERRSDKEELDRYLDYQKTCKKRAQSKERPEEVFPQLRFLPSDTTRPGYLKAQMAAEAHGGYTTYIDIPEIEMLINLCGGKKQVTQMLRLIHDRQIYQALRATLDGVSGRAVLRTCITMSCTPIVVRNFLKYNLYDGTLGRIVFSYKPRTNRDGRIPRVGKFSDDFYRKLDERLGPLALCKGRHIIRPLNKLIEQLAVEMAELGDLTDNDVLWDYSKRSLVAAWKAGCIMWILNDMTWTRSMADVVRYLVAHDIWSRWAVFGEMLKEGESGTTEASGKTGPANMLDSIEGNTFNEQQLDALRQSLGKPTGAATRKQLSVWSARGWIEHSAQTGLYTKTEAYLNRTR